VWKEWRKILSNVVSDDWSHKNIVSLLRKEYGISHWWAQTITIDYEKATGKRVTGQTYSAGFQIGVQTTVPLSKKKTWELLVSPEGIRTWLGDVKGFDFSEGTKYQTENGTVGEIRVLRPFHHVRLSWKPENWAESSTLQIAVVSKTEGKTALRIHHEKLTNEKVRNQMRAHWQNVLNKLKEKLY
jgi:uncharacterized protein YndB with AHSA1/START domain